MNLTRAQLATIIYEKTSGETTTRSIIPTALPTDLIRAIDVTELSPDDRNDLAALYVEYQEYVDTFMSSMFNFDTWIEHTYNKPITPKWRSFKSSGLR